MLGMREGIRSVPGVVVPVKQMPSLSAVNAKCSREDVQRVVVVEIKIVESQTGD